MKFACLIATALALVMPGHAQRPQRPVKLFNGKDLSGWEGDRSLWSVDDGVITGVTTASGDGKIEQNTFLIYKAGEVDDFELTFEARVTGENNSGIQYRSHVSDPANSVVSGYQLDLHPQQNCIGRLYEEKGRGILARRGTAVRIRPGGKSQVLGIVDKTRQIDVAQWNKYKITARGSRLIHWVNGQVTCSAVDDDTARRSFSGVIAIELHTGAPMKVEVKDIVIRRYNRSHAAAPQAPPPSDLENAEPALPAWIWTKEDLIPGEAAYFRRPWRQDKDVESATLTIAAHDKFTAFLNGEKIGGGNSNTKAYAFDISAGIKSNYNHLAIRASNTGEPAGLAAHLLVTHTDGSTFELVTDHIWTGLGATDDPENWKTNPTSRRAWKPCSVIGEMGIEPWGNLFAPADSDGVPSLPQATGPQGFKLDIVYDVPLETQGSWVALAAADRGRLFASAQNGSLYQITLPQGNDPVIVEEIDLPIGRANGLLWAFDSLFVCVNGEASGLYRITDRDGDGRLDTPSKLKSFRGSGELGPHGIVRGPGAAPSIYVVCGKHTELPDQLGRRRPPQVWGDDQLLPAAGKSDSEVPGAWICMTRPGGREWELHSVGLRNPYDIAFNQRGDLFTCDADSPSDQGTPFHRPTSLYHVPKGADFGARGLARNFPSEYPDTLPPLIELGPGSPTGIIFGNGSAFPARYQEALFTCDWSRSAIDAIHLTPTGATYRAEREEFITGADLRVTDIVVADDGAMYFTTGGRAQASSLWRITYTGDESSAPHVSQPFPPDIARKHSRLGRLGNLQGVDDPLVIDTAWPSLSDPDRLIRHAARTAIEHHAPELWLEKFRSERDPEATLELAIALARTGEDGHQQFLIDRLAQLDFSSLSDTQKIRWLRAHGLAFIRLSPATEKQRSDLSARLVPHFPSGPPALDIELSRMLIYLGAPGSIEQTLALAGKANDRKSGIAYASFLATATDGWTSESKANYLECLEKTASWRGDANFQAYLDALKAEFSRKEASKTNE